MMSTQWKWGWRRVDAVWDIALTDEEIKALGDGVLPIYVQPKHLVYYAPLENEEYAKALLDAQLEEGQGTTMNGR